MNRQQLAQSAEQGHTHDVVSCRHCTRARQADRTKTEPTPPRAVRRQTMAIRPDLYGPIVWSLPAPRDVMHYGPSHDRTPSSVLHAPKGSRVPVSDGYADDGTGALRRTTPRRGLRVSRHSMVKAPS